jgi:integrase/recombinase XerD
MNGGADPTTSRVPGNEQMLLERWLDHVWMERGLGDHTLAGYRSDLEQCALWLAEQRSALLQADRIRLLEWLADMMQRGLSARSVARKMSALRGFYRWALRENLITEDPTLLISRPKIGRPLPKSLTEADVDALLAAADTDTVLGLRDRAMLEVLYASGLPVTAEPASGAGAGGRQGQQGAVGAAWRGGAGLGQSLPAAQPADITGRSQR